MINRYGRKTRLKITTCQYTDEVTELLARKIRKMEQYKDCKITCYGPMGLGATCSISVERNDELIGFLTIGYAPSETGFGSFEYRDYNAQKKSYISRRFYWRYERF